VWQVIIDISHEIVLGKHSDVGASSHMRNTVIVDKAVDLVRDQASGPSVCWCPCREPRFIYDCGALQGLARARLWDFYTIHVDGALQDVLRFFLFNCHPLEFDDRDWEPNPDIGNQARRRAWCRVVVSARSSVSVLLASCSVATVLCLVSRWLLLLSMSLSNKVRRCCTACAVFPSASPCGEQRPRHG
jgi:hypothetical protein